MIIVAIYYIYSIHFTDSDKKIFNIMANR